MAQTQWMRQRVELMKAMSSSEFTIKQGECDYTPPLELVGVYIAHCTISRMVTEGKLDPAAATYLNAALGCNTFCVLHHCTHESISQHNVEHEAFENTVFRLACLLLRFDDGYKEAHRGHHARTNQHDDPDLILSHSSLPVFGHVLLQMTGHGEGDEVYIHLGAPIDHKRATFLYNFGILKQLTRMRVQKMIPLINWDNVMLKMATFEAQKVLGARKEYAKLHQALRSTWHSSNTLAYMILGLFFARYPHRNGAECKNEVDSFYDQTYRGQGQVDLWMMGEGAHHMHHAKSDVSYAVLAKVGADVEEKHPHLKISSRGNDDVRGLEYTHEVPPKLLEDCDGPAQFPWERTLAVREGKSLLCTDPASALAQIADAVLKGALHCCTTADGALLRELHKGMKLDGVRQAKDHPTPIASWPSTVLSQHTVDVLLQQSDSIRAEVSNVARDVGAKMPKLQSDEEIKERYLDFFVALADTMVSPEQQLHFMKQCSASFSASQPNFDRAAMLSRLREFLASPVPDNFARVTLSSFHARNRKTNYKNTRRRASNVFFGPHSRL